MKKSRQLKMALRKVRRTSKTLLLMMTSHLKMTPLKIPQLTVILPPTGIDL